MPAAAICSGRRPTIGVPVERDAGRGVDHARDRAQRRRLARAVRAEDHDDLALVDGEVEAVQHPHRAVAGPQLARPRAARVTAAGVPEVGLDDARVVADLGGRALGDLAAEVEHDDLVGDRHDHRHVVLDEQHA